jgi:poly(3-hydroxybutyrate) depolymerase
LLEVKPQTTASGSNLSEGHAVMYQQFDNLARMRQPLRDFSITSQSWINHWRAFADNPWLRKCSGFHEQVALLGFTHEREDFGIQSVVDAHGVTHDVVQERVWGTAFCHLLRFKKAHVEDGPRVLLVAPMSGHFATLLKGTIQTLVQDHEVYVTDWINIRDVEPQAGEFSLESYTEQLILMLQHLGPGCHLVGVCQPTVSCLAATAIMSAHQDESLPISLTLMAGPIDTRQSPTRVNELAKSKSIDWFKDHLVSRVPLGYRGAGREVYPGFVQVGAFLNMNLERHQNSLKRLYELRALGRDLEAKVIYDFYKEYFAVMDLPGRFYLETVKEIFQDHALPLGQMHYKGERVKPQLIEKTFLLTIEGERDDICGLGQTLAAQELCSGIAAWKKNHHLQAGVGHYGVFSGQRWSTQIYPVVRHHIQAAQSAFEHPA